MSLLKSKFGLIALIIVALVVAVVLVIVNRPDADGGASGSTIGSSTPTPSASPDSEPVNEADPSDAAGEDDNWPSDWPAKPKNPTPIPEDKHNHDPAGEEGAIQTDLHEPEVEPSDYVDDLGHEHEGEEDAGPVIHTFPSYKPNMTKFAKAYVDGSKNSSQWLKGISPYVSEDLKAAYEGLDPKALGFPKGEVSVKDEDDNITGKVKFSVNIDNEPVAIIIAQYQVDWTVIEIDAP